MQHYDRSGEISGFRSLWTVLIVCPTAPVAQPTAGCSGQFLRPAASWLFFVPPLNHLGPSLAGSRMDLVFAFYAHAFKWSEC
jgi:hypothetical protein